MTMAAVSEPLVEPTYLTSAWKALENHSREARTLHLRDLFAGDPQHGGRMTAEAGGVFLDYSKNRITDETMLLLLQLPEQAGTPVYDYEPGAWGPADIHQRIAPVDGWNDPVVKPAAPEVRAA
jgi:hypothetical protein